MSYPGQKYRQEHGKNSMPGQNQPQGQNQQQSYQQPGHSQNQQQGYQQPGQGQNQQQSYQQLGQGQNQQQNYHSGSEQNQNYYGGPGPMPGQGGYGSGPPSNQGPGGYNTGPGYNQGPYGSQQGANAYPSSNQNFPGAGGMPSEGNYGPPGGGFPMPSGNGFGFPQGGGMPGGNMPGGGMPGGGMSFPGHNSAPTPPYQQANQPGYNNYGPPGQNYNHPPPGQNYNHPPPGQNFNNGPSSNFPPTGNPYGGFEQNGRQSQFQAPPQAQPENPQLSHQPPPTQAIPNNQPAPQNAGGYVPVSNFHGKKKALLVGINYFGTNAALRGCINDVKNVRNFISQNYKFQEENMVILTDDQKDNPSRLPTRNNMIQAMKWLVQGAQPNDSLFFHFSGHGSQQKDEDGDEADGFDETICPMDYKTAGMLVDDEMNTIMVRSLPPGCRLTAIMDCCHSGTALDLPYLYNQDGKLISYSPAKAAKTLVTDLGKKYMTGDMVGALMSLKSGVSSLTKGNKSEKYSKDTRSSMADVVMFSGCDDNQTSADAVESGVGNTGAMSFALIKALGSNPHNLSYISLLQEVREILRGKYTQVPQLSSGRPMDMNAKFDM